MDLGIKNRVALVSGADSGMGKETARLLLEAGCRVAITDKGDNTLPQAAEELSALGEVIALAADVQVKAAFAAVAQDALEGRLQRGCERSLGLRRLEAKLG